MATMGKMATCLWFDTQAEEAAKYYTTIFKNSKMGRKALYTSAGKEKHQKPEGSVMTVEFELDGAPFLALNGGSQFRFNEAVSLMIRCKTQEEIDYYWEKLSAGGDKKAQECGWLKDKYGLSWQVVPEKLADWTTDPDKEKRERVVKQFMDMKKINLDVLENAAKNRHEVEF